MRIAIPESKGRVSPVFDTCQRIVLYEAEKKSIKAVGAADLTSFTMAMRVGILRAYGVTTLICGALSSTALRALNATGIEVLSFLCGDISLLIRAYTDGTIFSSKFLMPGCACTLERSFNDSEAFSTAACNGGKT